jgi:hypothetical protein
MQECDGGCDYCYASWYDEGGYFGDGSCAEYYEQYAPDYAPEDEDEDEDFDDED